MVADCTDMRFFAYIADVEAIISDPKKQPIQGVTLVGKPIKPGISNVSPIKITHCYKCPQSMALVVTCSDSPDALCAC
mgnify:CR=1 FL=1